jgi:CTP-dependent riboflavin kinase
MTEVIVNKGFHAQDLAEIRAAMIDMGKRDGDQWAEHRAAGIVREGQHNDAQIDVIKPDGTVVRTEVLEIINVNGDRDTLFQIDANLMGELFPKPARNRL